jgi:superfamily I DNA/RNA helicase
MTTVSTATRVWSSEQEAIFAWFSKYTTVGNLLDLSPLLGYEITIDVNGNLVIRARAGCGKTTTIIEGVQRAPETNKLICAYNKKIAEELVARISTPGVTIKTLHALGLAAIKRYRDRIKIDFSNARAEALTDAVCGKTAPDAIKKLVTKLHTKGREIAPHARNVGDLTDIALRFECEPDEAWASTFPLEYVEQRALAAMELASDIKSGDTIDGSDMIFLPVRNGWLHKQYDLVVVDEAQDMTTAQLEIAQGVCKGRICIVGDDKQAIYAFRGADSESLDRLKREMNASELGLKTTYRCGRAIVEMAQQLVPDFTAGDNNTAGLVSHIESDALTASAAASDFILSRTNAPLVSIAMTLLRNGKRTRVAGRDIGAGLSSLVRKFRARSVPELLTKIGAWESRETARVDAMLKTATNGRKRTLETKIEGIRDQAEMLVSLTDGAQSVSDVEARIGALFTDDGLGQAGVITCSSVHRSKGLEASRVFVLSDTLRSHNQEELNIQYVAITRAKDTLVMVSEKR